MTTSDLDKTYLHALSGERVAMAAAVDFINAHRELAHEEVENAGYLADRLEDAGYAVERGVGGMPTAFRAELTGALPGRRIGVATVYDAVTTHRGDGTVEALHACGHGPMSGGILGTALALAAMRDTVAGAFVVVGCPADEIHSAGTRTKGSGKAETAAAGVWDDVDVALYAHPEFIDTVWLESLWMLRETAIIPGFRSLDRAVASAPMDALNEILRVVGEGDPARLMLETAVLDGDVEDGVGLNLLVRLLIWSETEAGLEDVVAPVHAALPDVTWTRSNAIAAIRPDEAVNALVTDAFAAVGRTVEPAPPMLPFATDFGNVTQRIPGALVGVGRSGGWGFHRDHGVDEFAGPQGKEIAESIATVIGLAALRLSQPVG